MFLFGDELSFLQTHKYIPKVGGIKKFSLRDELLQSQVVEGGELEIGRSDCDVWVTIIHWYFIFYNFPHLAYLPVGGGNATKVVIQQSRHHLMHFQGVFLLVVWGCGHIYPAKAARV